MNSTCSSLDAYHLVATLTRARRHAAAPATVWDDIELFAVAERCGQGLGLDGDEFRGSTALNDAQIRSAWTRSSARAGYHAGLR